MQASFANFIARLGALPLFATTLTVAASNIDAGKSQITAAFRQMNVPVDGRFTTFSGNIVFDPKKASAGRARIEIDTASFDVGAPEYNDELRAKEWLDTSTYPKASFVSSRVTGAGPNRFEASGRLSLKGKISEIKVSFSQRFEGKAAVFEGEFPLSRKTYSIGGPAWDQTVADQVVVKFRIVTGSK